VDGEAQFSHVGKGEPFQVKGDRQFVTVMYSVMRIIHVLLVQRASLKRHYGDATLKGFWRK